MNRLFYVLLKSYIILCRVELEEMNWKRIRMSEGLEGWFYEEKRKIGQAPSMISYHSWVRRVTAWEAEGRSSAYSSFQWPTVSSHKWLVVCHSVHFIVPLHETNLMSSHLLRQSEYKTRRDAECLQFISLGKHVICKVEDEVLMDSGECFCSVLLAFVWGSSLSPSHCRTPCAFCIHNHGRTSTLKKKEWKQEN